MPILFLSHSWSDTDAARTIKQRTANGARPHPASLWNLKCFVADTDGATDSAGRAPKNTIDETVR
jgi:hypothetical protein